MPKIKFYPRTFFIVVSLLVALACLYCRGSWYYEISTAHYLETDLDDYLVGVYGCERDGSRFHVTGNDPQLVFDFSNLETEIYGFRVTFQEEVKNVQVYYGHAVNEFSENHSYFIKKSDQNTIQADVLQGGSCYRLDVNEDFEIDRIEISDEVLRQKITKGIGSYVKDILLCVAAALLCALIGPLDQIFGRWALGGKAFLKALLYHKRLLLALPIGTAALFFISFGLEKWHSVKYHMAVNPYRIVCIFTMLFLIYLLVLCRKLCVEAFLHWLIGGIILILGTVQLLVTPPSTGTATDDQIHYAKSAYLSWGATGVLSKTDVKMREAAYAPVSYDRAGRSKWISEINEVDQYRRIEHTDKYRADLKYISYVPAAIGLMIGRGLGLSFIHTFLLGKFINLFCYAVVCASAVRRLKDRGKILASVIAMIPTNIYLAASYSYDWWITAGLLLGFAMVIEQLQTAGKVSLAGMIRSMCVMVLGMLPKAIYFPLIVPVMCFQRDKYQSAKKCRIAATAAMLLLLASFVIPMFTSGANLDDMRGGADVNSMAQMRFILTEPFQYLQILGKFMQNYLSPDASWGFLTYMMYLGTAPYFVLCVAALVGAVLLDNIGEKERWCHAWHLKAGTLVSVAVTLVLVATALYVSFTPLRHPTVNGCQPRYITPVLFPLAFFCGKLPIQSTKEVKRGYMLASIAVMAFVFLNGMLQLGADRYL